MRGLKVSIRFAGNKKLGDAGTTYEFNVKLPVLYGKVSEDLSDEMLGVERELALEAFTDTLKAKYPWAGKTYFTGRSGGWLAIEDPRGEMTADTLKELSAMVYQAHKEFIQHLKEEFPFEVPKL